MKTLLIKGIKKNPQGALDLLMNAHPGGSAEIGSTETNMTTIEKNTARGTSSFKKNLLKRPSPVINGQYCIIKKIVGASRCTCAKTLSWNVYILCCNLCYGVDMYISIKY